MPYSVTNLTQTGAALNAEMKAPLDAALTASGKYTKVTNAYAASGYVYDVWRNDGTTDGYEWYLIVATHTSYPGRVLTGGALEYDDATKTARKALRGPSGVGFVDAAGYPLAAAGGAELTFPLGSFAIATAANTSGLLSAFIFGNTSYMPPSAAGGVVRVLVTGQLVWVWWSTATPTTPAYCCGVGTYQNWHSTTDDLKPLAFMAYGPGSTGATYGTYIMGTSAWQHPSGTDGTARGAYSHVLETGLGFNDPLLWTRPIGVLGGGGQDLISSGIYTGSRYHVIRNGNDSVASNRGGLNPASSGYSLGLAPADLLLFAKNNAVLVGDTVNVNGKIYVSVSPKWSTGVACGLFVNTQPEV